MEGFDYFDLQKKAVKKVKEIDKEVDEAISNGGKGMKRKLTQLRFEQMLRGLYITEDPLNLK